MAQLDPLGIMDADLDSCVPTDIITSSDKLGEQQQLLGPLGPARSHVAEGRNRPGVLALLDRSPRGSL